MNPEDKDLREWLLLELLNHPSFDLALDSKPEGGSS